MKENIHKFMESRTVIESTVIESTVIESTVIESTVIEIGDSFEEKYIRRRANIDKWSEKYIPIGSVIEFDDSAKAFLSAKESVNSLDTLYTLTVSIKDKDGKNLNLENMPFHLVLEIEKAVIDFFIHA